MQMCASVRSTDRRWFCRVFEISSPWGACALRGVSYIMHAEVKKERNDPNDRKDRENNLSYGIAKDSSELHTAAALFLLLAAIDLCFHLVDLLPVGQFLSALNDVLILILCTHWKLSSPFTAEDLL